MAVTMGAGPVSAGELIDLGALGDLGGNPACSKATAVSGDGTVVVGTAEDALQNRQGQAFRWTAKTGMERLAPPREGDAPVRISSANAVSADGRVIVGKIDLGDPRHFSGFRAFRWAADTGLLADRSPDPYQGFSTEAKGISASGTVVAGDSGLGPFRKTEAKGQEQLAFPEQNGALSRRAWSIAAMSADGAVIIGRADDDGPAIAFQWTETSGMAVIEPPQDVQWIMPAGISADGAVIVGQATRSVGPNAATTYGFRRDGEGRWTFLPLLPGMDSAEARAVSGDGSVVAGLSINGSSGASTTFLWTRATGTQATEDRLKTAGVALPDLKTLPGGRMVADIAALSNDGSVMVGTLWNCHAFVASMR
jgi:uncharacterized membrane protein